MSRFLSQIRTLLRATAALSSVVLLSGCPSDAGQVGGGTGLGPGNSVSAAARDEVEVRAGSFDMGCESGEDDERPVHRQSVESFFLDRKEVTNREYRAFLAALAAGAKIAEHEECPLDKDHRPSFPARDRTTRPFPDDYFSNAKYDEYPVIGVDWFDAYAFAAWLGRRLPSEVEWEYAARGPEGRLYPWGEDSPLRPTTRANFYTPVADDEDFGRGVARFEKFGSAKVLAHYDGFPLVAPVGSFPEGASRSGALDMAGNVWEWTASAYTPYARRGEAVKKARTERVVRGGAWDSPSSYLFRGSNRVSCDPAVRRFNIGFRTARSVPRSSGN